MSNSVKKNYKDTVQRKSIPLRDAGIVLGRHGGSLNTYLAYTTVVPYSVVQPIPCS